MTCKCLKLYRKFLSTLSLRRATFSADLKGNFITFLSTLSLRRATIACFLSVMSFAHFYPRSPCGERHKLQDGRNSQHIISIHALLAESDAHQ